MDTKHPPSVLHARGAANAPPKELFLNWDRALDDRGCLRRCPACGCDELFARRSIPQITGLVAVVLVGVAAIVFLRLRVVVAGLLVLALVAAMDVAIRLFAGWRLVCYGCGAEFSDLPIDRRHPRWDMAVAEKYRLREKHLDAESGVPPKTGKGV